MIFKQLFRFIYLAGAVACLRVKLVSRLFAFQNSGEAERLESISKTLVEFAHELDPEIAIAIKLVSMTKVHSIHEGIR